MMPVLFNFLETVSPSGSVLKLISCSVGYLVCIKVSSELSVNSHNSEGNLELLKEWPEQLALKVCPKKHFFLFSCAFICRMYILKNKIW